MSGWSLLNATPTSILTSDGTGQYLVAILDGGSGGVPHYSTDYGATWTASTGVPLASNDVFSISSRSSGQYVLLAYVVGVNGTGVLYTSSDYGATYAALSTLPSASSFTQVAQNSDGTVQIVASNDQGFGNGYLFVSTDSGATWPSYSLSLSPVIWQNIACSSNGQYIYAVGQDGSSVYHVYASADTGATWSQLTDPSSGATLGGISCDSTGQYVVVTAGTAGIFRSTDYGVTWTVTSAPLTASQSYGPLVGDTTGTFLLACDTAHSTVYLSSNAGESWTSTYSTATNVAISGNGVQRFATGSSGIVHQFGTAAWSLMTGVVYAPVVISVNNQYMVAIRYPSSGNDRVVYSSDSGATWTNADDFGNVQYIAADSSGQYVVAMLDTGAVYRSSDYGATFSQLMNVPDSQNYGIVSSSDGTRLILTSNAGGIYVSADSGGSWMKMYQNGAIAAGTLIASYSGQFIYLVINGNSVSISYDYGVSWLQPQPFTSYSITQLACDATGQYVVAACGNDGIWRSTNYGVTWTKTSAPSNPTISNGPFFIGIANDSTGTRLIAQETSTNVTYTSSDAGLTWNIESTPGGVSASGISLSPDGTQYFSAFSNGTYMTVMGSPTTIPTITPGAFPVGPAWVPLNITRQELIFTHVSLNGSYAAAINYDGVYYSSDYGFSWSTSDVPSAAYLCLAASLTGQYVVVSDALGNLYKSSNYGATYTLVASSLSLPYAIAISSDGQYFYALSSDGTGDIYIGSGETVTTTNVGTSITWYSITCDSTGAYVYATGYDALYNGLLYASADYGATWALNTTLPAISDGNANQIACDSTGQLINLAAGPQGIYQSTNGGSTWAQLSAPIAGRYWLFLASDSTGTNLIAGDYIGNGTVFTSSDSGATWVERLIYNINGESLVSVSIDPTGAYYFACFSGLSALTNQRPAGFPMAWPLTNGVYYYQVAISATNQYMAAVAAQPTGNFLVAYSSDSGATWTNAADFGNVQYIAADSTGHYVVAMLDTGAVYRSTNYGVTFSQLMNVPAGQYYGITSSSDGTRLVIISNVGGVYVSADSGLNWKETYVNSSIYSGSQVSNYSGQYIYTAFGVSVNLSYDYGISWYQNFISSYGVNAVACDATGQYVVAACGIDGVYRSTDYGTTWTKQSLLSTPSVSNGPAYYSIASDSTGQRLITFDNTSAVVYTSINGGTTWTPNYTEYSSTSGPGLSGVSLSPDGTYYIASSYSPGTYFQTMGSAESIPSVAPGAGAVGDAWVPINTTRPDITLMNIVSDSTGQHMAALSGTHVLFSPDYGYTWSTSNAPSNPYTCMASSGPYVTVGYGTSGSGGVFQSIDYGVTYTNLTESIGFIPAAIATSSNGAYVYVTSSDGSGNFYGIGSSVQNQPTENPFTFTSICCDSTGQYVYLSGYDASNHYGVLFSIDYGVSWNGIVPFASTLDVPIQQIACDSTGQILVVAASTDGIYRSTNGGTSWTLLSAPTLNRSWSYVASDATGTHLVAGENNFGVAYTSSDSGTTWTERLIYNIPGYGLQSVAITSTGTHSFATYDTLGPFIDQYPSGFPPTPWTLAAGTEYLQVVSSYDNLHKAAIVYNDSGNTVSYYSGSTWTASTGITGNVTCITCDSTGQYVVVGTNTSASQLYQSTDYGATFVVLSGSPSSYWTAVQSDSTGMKVVACDFNGGIANVYTTTDMFATYNTSDIYPGHIILSMAASSTLYTMYMLVQNTDTMTKSLRMSSNGGYSWSAISTFSGYDVQGVACDYIGFQVYATAGHDGVYVSSNYGANWVKTSAPSNLLSGPNFTSLACNLDGNHVAALDTQNLLVYVSTNQGLTWMAQNTPGNSAGSVVNNVSISPDGTMYSALFANVGTYSTTMGSAFLPPAVDSSAWVPVNISRSDLAPFTYVACNSTSQYMVALSRGDYNGSSLNTSVSYSSDYGLTWRISNAPSNGSTTYTCLASSGQYVVVGFSSLNNGIYQSTDYGATYTSITSALNFTPVAIAISSDGQYCYAATNDASGIYLGTSYGAMVTQNSTVSSITWTSIACDSTGQYVYASGSSSGNYAVYASTNYGVDWVPLALFTSSSGIVINQISCDSTGLIVVVAAADGLYRSTNGGAAWTVMSAPSDRNWTMIASNATGVHLIAGDAFFNVVLTSADSGVTWTQKTIPGAPASGIQSVSIDSTGTYEFACYNGLGALMNQYSSGLVPWTLTSGVWYSGTSIRADNQYLIATDYDTNNIVYSVNGGSTWDSTGNGSSSYVGATAISQSGQYIVYLSSINDPLRTLFQSIDYGATFSPLLYAPTVGDSIACNQTGQYLYVTGYNSNNVIHVSYNYGGSWRTYTVTSGSVYFYRMAVSYSGQYVYLVGNNNYLYRSADAGQTWSSQANPTDYGVGQIACDATGQYVVISCTIDGIYRSTDYGATWTKTSAPSITSVSYGPSYESISSSSTGNRLVAEDVRNNMIYISMDGGTTWTGAYTPDSSVSEASGYYSTSISPDGTYYSASFLGHGPGTYSIAMGSAETIPTVAPYYPSTVPCFLEGSQILCQVAGIETYLAVETIRPGTLVKTALHGFKPVTLIGHRSMQNSGTNDKNDLYLCTKAAYPELTADLTLTGCHAILVDQITDLERKGIMTTLERIFVTDRKYRLPACVDTRATVVPTVDTFTVWHFALEHSDVKMNYGVYAQGLLVESSPIWHMNTKNYTLIQ